MTFDGVSKPKALQPAGDADRPLPYNGEAERSVLGAILIDNAYLAVARNENLESEHFFLVQHRYIFAAMVRVADHGDPINSVSLEEEFNRCGQLQAAGGLEYLTELATAIPKRTNVAWYARKIREKTTLRRIAFASNPICEQALAADEPEEIVARAQAMFSQFSTVEPDTSEPDILDLPEACLDGSLGEICRVAMSEFPRAYAYPALLAAASVRVIPNPIVQVRTNLYVALVGPIHSGNSCAIQAAQRGLGIPDELLETSLAGSAEGLLAKIGVRLNPVLLSPDELSHLLTKAQIQNASLPYVLPRLYYQDTVRSIAAGRKQIEFSARVSILGGVVEENFGDHFGAASMNGLYDRFIFGHDPSDYLYIYRELPAFGALNEFLPPGARFMQTRIDNSVWEWVRALRKEEPGLNPRVIENALRVASICASIDGRLLRAEDLGPTREFIRYQSRERIILQPNPGKNSEGVLAYRILSHLEKHRGEWLLQRVVMHKVHGSDFGPAVWNRVITALVYRGDIEMRDGSRKNQKLLRALCDCLRPSETAHDT
jgi:hypothetical protein